MNSVYEVRPAHIEDCLYVAEHLSEADRIEVAAVRGDDMRSALRECFLKSSFSWSVFLHGQNDAAFVFGVSRVDWCWTELWALSTPAVCKYPVAFARGSRKVAALLFERYLNVRGYVDARHVKSIRWLEFMGFKLDTPVTYGRNSELFIPFYHSER